MEDPLIIKLLEERSEQGISEMRNKYGPLCGKIMRGILKNEQDVQECMNDTWLAVWNQIPPQKPDPFISYLCRIAKNQALKKREYLHAQKRNSDYEVALDELEKVLGGARPVEDEVMAAELSRAMNAFLEKQVRQNRIFFVRRYWFGEKISEIARECGVSPNYVTVHLHRMRHKLKSYLQKEGMWN